MLVGLEPTVARVELVPPSIIILEKVGVLVVAISCGKFKVIAPFEEPSEDVTVILLAVPVIEVTPIFETVTLPVEAERVIPFPAAKDVTAMLARAPYTKPLEVVVNAYPATPGWAKNPVVLTPVWICIEDPAPETPPSIFEEEVARPLKFAAVIVFPRMDIFVSTYTCVEAIPVEDLEPKR
jgi:hypothetical protein